MEKNIIEVDKEAYENLLINSFMLKSLEEAGVDNWDGLSKAQEIFDEKMEILQELTKGNSK